MSKDHFDLIIIGAGASGFFAANLYAEVRPDDRILLLEKSNKTLAKVRISGGGRCNATHHCFSPAPLSKHYPRGARFLKKAFGRFGPEDMIHWFADRGVELKTEADGRMFPITDDSATIVDCFQRVLEKPNVQLHQSEGLSELEQRPQGEWQCTSTKGMTYTSSKVLMAAGSNNPIWQLLQGLGQECIAPVPSLFTFKIRDPRLDGLSGVSMPLVETKILGSKLQEQGPILITHWGLSGPAVLKLSAWGARELKDLDYRFRFRVNWVPGEHFDSVASELASMRQSRPKKKVVNLNLYDIPSRLWGSLCAAAGIQPEVEWGNLGKKELNRLATELTQCDFEVDGKATFKDEFVTAGGVDLAGIDAKTMQSKSLPGLYFSGEVMNIDGITGGFNFQSCWTTAYLAVQDMVTEGQAG